MSDVIDIAVARERRLKRGKLDETASYVVGIYRDGDVYLDIEHEGGPIETFALPTEIAEDMAQRLLRQAARARAMAARQPDPHPECALPDDPWPW